MSSSLSQMFRVVEVRALCRSLKFLHSMSSGAGFVQRAMLMLEQFLTGGILSLQPSEPTSMCSLIEALKHFRTSLWIKMCVKWLKCKFGSLRSREGKSYCCSIQTHSKQLCASTQASANIQGYSLG